MKKIAILSMIAIIGLLLFLAASKPDNVEVVSEAVLAFPLSLPDETITVQKAVDEQGNFVFTSNSPRVKSYKDLRKLEQDEYKAKKAKYGALGDGLIEKIAALKGTEKVRVSVSFKVQERPKLPNKMEHSTEYLKEMSRQHLQRVPLVEKDAFLVKHKITEVKIKEKELEQKSGGPPCGFLADVDKNNLKDLCFDVDVSSVEEFIDPEPCTTPICPECRAPVLVGGEVFANPICLSTYTNSAYNPACAMPEDAKGQGVNAATWEKGLRPAFVNCINVLNLIAYNSTQNGQYDIYHSETTFKVLANTAPYANLYHRKNYYFSYNGYDDPFLWEWGIQTVSCSTNRPQGPTGEEMRHMDMWAYRWPYIVFCNPTNNNRYCDYPDWRCYNAINVGNVRHFNENNYMLVDTAHSCGCILTNNWSQTANPPDIWGSEVMFKYNCSSCNPGPRGDREMPMIVAPGISPIGDPWSAGHTYTVSDPCILRDEGDYVSCIGWGTSISAPIVNGISACVISSDYRMRYWPEKVRVALLATAHNVDFSHWNCKEDGRDGAGVVSGADAVWFARNHTETWQNTSAPFITLEGNSMERGDI